MAVQCEGVSKSYRPVRPLGIKELFVGRHRKVGRFAREWALRDVSFDLPRGQAFGLVGPNGSGKSTLLSLLLGAIRTDTGRITVNGRVASLLELGSGFHPELTGRQNVFLYGAILGMRIREVRERFDAIIAFSELADAIDNPLRTYSSGMVARLGFSTIIHAAADILLVDEILGVGDMEFQRKCRDFLICFKRAHGTLVIASHDLMSVRALCDTGICLDEGRVISHGPIARVIDAYKDLVSRPLRYATAAK